MVTLRCTKKLPSAKSAVTSLAPSTTRLGDWYITILHTRPKHLLLCVSEHSRLAVLFPAAPLATFVPRFGQALREVLEESGIPDEVIARELGEMATFQFGPTQSRSHVGTLIEYVKTLEYQESDDEPDSALSRSLFLNQMIWRPLEYRTPDEVTRRVLAAGVTVL